MSIDKFYIKKNDLQPYYKILVAGDGSTSISTMATYNDSGITVSSTDSFPYTGSIRIFDYITITYTGKSVTTFTGCTWAGGAVAQTFAIGTQVTEVKDLTGATIVFTMATTDGVTKKVNRQAAVITNPTGGEVEYRWVSGNTDTSGPYLCEFEITPASGGKFTVPTKERAVVVVVDDLDAT
jgi:hypothetical protein